MTQAKTFKRNSIQFHEPESVTQQLLIWLAENAKELGLLIFCVECSYEKGTQGKEVFSSLKKQATQTIKDNCETGDRIIHEKNLGSLVFYMHAGKAYGLSITFGRHEAHDLTIDYEQKKDIQAFICQLNQSNLARHDLFQLPLLRICLTIYALKKSLSTYTEQMQRERVANNQYAILGFANDSLVYRWSENNDIFRVDLSHGFGSEDTIYLKVMNPLGRYFKDNDLAQSCLRLIDPSNNALSFYDRSALSNKKMLGNGKKPNAYKRYFSHEINEKQTNNKFKKRAKNEEELKKELVHQLQTRMVNEVFWNAQLESLLTEAGIAYSRQLFIPRLGVFLPREKHENFMLSMQPMGVDLSSITKTHLRKNGYALRYAFMVDESEESECETLKAQLTHAVKEINTNKDVAKLYLKEVPFNAKLTQTDLVIDIKEKAKETEKLEDTTIEHWKSAQKSTPLDYYGQHRKKTIEANQVTDKQLISSFLLKSDGAVNVLYRSVTDLLLKKWLRSPSPLRHIQAKLPPLQSKQFIVMGSRLWRQVNSLNTPKLKSPIPYNIFTAFYGADLRFDPALGNVMQIDTPETHFNWKVNKNELKKSGFLSYLAKMKATQRHAKRLQTLLSAVPHNNALMGRLKERFLNHGVTYLFEIDAGMLLTVWEITPEHSAGLIADLQYKPIKDDFSFHEFIIAQLKRGSFSRDDKFSQIIENKRNIKNAEYEVDYSGNEVLIARKIHQEKQHTDRVLLQRINRIYSANGSTELNEKDLEPLLAGLLSDTGAQHKMSGAKQSFYEKLIKLMISDG